MQVDSWSSLVLPPFYIGKTASSRAWLTRAGTERNCVRWLGCNRNLVAQSRANAIVCDRRLLNEQTCLFRTNRVEYIHVVHHKQSVHEGSEPRLLKSTKRVPKFCTSAAPCLPLCSRHPCFVSQIGVHHPLGPSADSSREACPGWNLHDGW